MRATGGPREVSWPALKDAGGRLVGGERGSVPEAAACGEKYEGEVTEGVVGVEGFVARRDRDAETVELVNGTSAGAVLVRWCLGGVGFDGFSLASRCCAASLSLSFSLSLSLEGLREWRRPRCPNIGMADSSSSVLALTRQGSPRDQVM